MEETKDESVMYDDLKKAYIENIKEYVKENGNMFAHISVFAKHKTDDKNGIIHIPINGEFLESEESKDRFINEVVPQIAKKIREDFTTYGVAWVSEAWIRKADASEKETLSNWKKIPITGEVLLISMQFNDKKEVITFDILRDGKQVNDEGDLIDKVELVESDLKGDSFSGRFSGLYEKFVLD